MNDQTNLPVHREQMGAVSASVWMNHTDSGDPFYVATLTRTYRDPETGEWKDANSFGQRDLLAVALVAQHAAQKISYLAQADRRARSSNDVDPENSSDSVDSAAARSHENQHVR